MTFIAQDLPYVFNLKQWFSTPGRDPRGVVNYFWRGREQVIYVHRCIHLFYLLMGPFDCSGLLQWVAVQKRLKTTELKVQHVKRTHSNNIRPWPVKNSSVTHKLRNPSLGCTIHLHHFSANKFNGIFARVGEKTICRSMNLAKEYA